MGGSKAKQKTNAHDGGAVRVGGHSLGCGRRPTVGTARGCEPVLETETAMEAVGTAPCFAIYRLPGEVMAGRSTASGGPGYVSEGGL